MALGGGCSVPVFLIPVSTNFISRIGTKWPDLMYTKADGNSTVCGISVEACRFKAIIFL